MTREKFLKKMSEIKARKEASTAVNKWYAHESWIQSDTQCRAYANKLESKLARAKADAKEWEETAMDTAKELAEALAELQEAEAEMAEMREALEDIEKYAGHVTRCEPNLNCRGGCDQARKAEQVLSGSGGKRALRVIEAAKKWREHSAESGAWGNGTIVTPIEVANELSQALRDWEAGR